MTLDQLRELLTQLRDNPAGVTDDQLTAARAAIREQAGADGVQLETLRELATARTTLSEVITTRQATAAEREGLLADLTAEEPPEPVEPAAPEPAAADTDSATTTPPEVPTATEPANTAPVSAPAQTTTVAPAGTDTTSTTAAEPAPVAIAAAGQRAPLGAIQTRAPQPVRPDPTRVVVASTTANGGTASFQAGAPLATLTDLARAMAERVGSLGKSRAAEGERIHVARTTFTYPDARRLRPDASFETNMGLMDAVSAPDVLVASGGLCAPLQTLYDIDTIGSSARPIRGQALAPFAVERGGITYRPHASAAAAVNGVGIWTMDDDEDAGIGVDDPVKACYEVPCPGLSTAEVQAIYQCLEFANITARYDPESTASNIRQGVIAHARLAENELLRQIMAACKAVTGGTQEVGAVRHTLGELGKIVAYYRNRHRLDADTRFTWLLPQWVMDMYRVDLAYQMAAGDWMAALAVSEATIRSWFSAWGVTPVFHLDGGIGGTNEVQTITVTGSPTGGSYTLTYAGQTTGTIPWNATAAQVRTALEALSNIGANDIVTGGGPHPATAITVQFLSDTPGTDFALMTDTDAGLTGGTTPAVTVTTTTAPSTTTTISGITVPSQVYLNVAAGAEIPEFPAKVDSALYVTGTLLFLDGGTLDMGVVRDHVLNARNRYRQFMETFEGVASRDIEPLRVIIPAIPNGMSAGTADLLP